MNVALFITCLTDQFYPQVGIAVTKILEHFGCRPVDYLEECGWLNDRVWLAHGIHFNDDEVRRLGHHHVGVCHCPTSNMMLSSGQCRTMELEAAGSPVGLGVDGEDAAVPTGDVANLPSGCIHPRSFAA